MIEISNVYNKLVDKMSKSDLIRNKFFKLFGFATLGNILIIIAGSFDGIISGNLFLLRIQK